METINSYPGIADERDMTTVLIHNRQLVTMDTAHVAEFAERMRRVAAHGLARIAERRRCRTTAQAHISHYNEAAEVAAEVYDADPHGDLSWRNEFELSY